MTISPDLVSPEMIDQALQKVGLTALRHRHPFSLSGGEKQRLQIATAMVSQNEVILFDEPTSGLDFHSMNSVSELIRLLAADHGIVIISHDYEFIRKTANRIVHLEDGQILSDFVISSDTTYKSKPFFIK